MNKINFENLPSNNTPISADNLNQLQANVEEEINLRAPLSTTPQTPNGDTKVTLIQLSYKEGWKLYVQAITSGEVHSFEADLTQID